MRTSQLVREQCKSKTRLYTRQGVNYKSTVNYRLDDRCGNGHNTFSVTMDTYRQASNGRWVEDSFGCQHDEIKKLFPFLAPFVKWHLTSTDSPMHYIANTVYLAGDRDCWGMRKGEFQQYKNKAGLLNWELSVPEKTDIYSATKPETITCEWKPCGRVGEGKARELDSARSTAVWPDATDEELTAPGLEDRLKARHAGLMEEFAKDMEALEFVF